MCDCWNLVFGRLRRPFIRRGSPPGVANGTDGWKVVEAGPIQTHSKTHRGFVVQIPEGLLPDCKPLDGPRTYPLISPETQKNKLLIFTEHKDTLEFLAGNEKDGRPLGKLIEWGLSVTQIHGGMKIGDRDSPGTRIYAEREFKEECQILVATEAAGEGINLQFCWLMINFDIPWNPVRLEQRVGRIHRYGQEKDCLIFNFVAQNTREGRVLRKLLDRLAEIRADLGSDQVFDVVGEVFPANQLERMLRDMYARQTDV